ncbi:MAG: filamentous hemagglutinin N-terminal domain-containing protein, partial [Gemmataceae bacterium]
MAALALGMASAPPLAYALPTGGQVSAGQASISTGAGSVNVTQTSSRAVIDWSGFNIGSGEQVDFSQPSSSAIALNRIHDSQPSSIDGQLNANGQVWLLNPTGIMFGSGAQVNVGGLVATTSNIS